MNAFIDRLAAGMGAVTDRVPVVLADPRSYPRETMVLALIVAVAILTLVISGVLVAELVGKARRRPLPVRATMQVNLVRTGRFLAIAAVVLFALSVLPLIPKTGELCDTCHSMAPQVGSWKAGDHAGISCYSCHARPGAFGAVERTFGGISAIAGLGTRKHGTASCGSCHSDVMLTTTVRDGIRVSHAEIVAGGLACVDCHEDAGHKASRPKLAAAAQPVLRRSAMSYCLRCHDGKQASAECSTCHVSGAPSDSPSEVKPVGNTPAPVTCDGCHMESTDKKCITCHGLQMPHPASFNGDHAELSSEKPSLCASCHEGASRNEGCACHTDVNVHGTFSEWFPQHGTAARRNGPAGCRCHDDAFCGYCHESNAWQ